MNVSSLLLASLLACVQCTQATFKVGSITGFKLVAAPTGAVICNLVEGTVVYLNGTNPGLNVVAVHSSGAGKGKIRSVQMGWNANPKFRTETNAPYTLCGGASFAVCTNLVAGNHTVTATARRKIRRGKAVKVSFQIVAGYAPGAPMAAPVSVPTTGSVPVTTPVSVPKSAPVSTPVQTPAAPAPASAPVIAPIPVTVPVVVPTLVTAPAAVSPVATPATTPVTSPVVTVPNTPVATAPATPVVTAPAAVPVTAPVSSPVAAAPVLVSVAAPVALPVTAPVAAPMAGPVTIQDPNTPAPIVNPTAAPVVASTSAPKTNAPVPVPTKAPVTATTAPVPAVVSTNAPVATTTAPVPSLFSTNAPVTSTTAPIAVTRAPITATSAPITATRAPITPTSTPITVTSAPVAATSAPVTATAAPVPIVVPTSAPITVTVAPVPIVAPTTAPIGPTLTSIKINCAGPAFTSATSGNWIEDTYFNAGSSTFTYWDANLPIAGTDDDVLYRSERNTGAGPLKYEIPVLATPASYRVTLHFAEIYTEGVNQIGQRVFDVKMEGVTRFNNVDLIQLTPAGRTKVTKTFTLPVTDGALTLDFIPVVRDAVISAIEVHFVPAGPMGTPAPVVATPSIAPVVAPTSAPVLALRSTFPFYISAVTEYTGTNVWVADTPYVSGGNVGGAAGQAIAGTTEEGLYRKERWEPAGNPIKYSVPVVNGNYVVVLHFSEGYGPNAFNGGRVFKAVLEKGGLNEVVSGDIDIFEATGAMNTAHTVTLSVTVADQTLNVEFIRNIENPTICGIEIRAQAL